MAHNTVFNYDKRNAAATTVETHGEEVIITIGTQRLNYHSCAMPSYTGERGVP